MNQMKQKKKVTIIANSSLLWTDGVQTSSFLSAASYYFQEMQGHTPNEGRIWDSVQNKSYISQNKSNSVTQGEWGWDIVWLQREIVTK